MDLTIKIGNKDYHADLNNPICISIPLNFNGDQPNAFGVQKATAKAYLSGSYIGDTREGGSCNFEEYKLITHCNGTHTECVGHITDKRIYVNDKVSELLMPSALISIKPESASVTPESYIPEKRDSDKLITRKALKSAMQYSNEEFLNALIIRTVPNDESKMTRSYTDNPPPYFSKEAMEFIDSLHLKHLLVDIPSLDRADDDGIMLAHHIYWGMPVSSHNADEAANPDRTITEMIFVPESIEDGNYFLNLQIPDFVTDSAPGRPVLYKFT